MVNSIKFSECSNFLALENNSSSQEPMIISHRLLSGKLCFWKLYLINPRPHMISIRKGKVSKLFRLRPWYIIRYRKPPKTWEDSNSSCGKIFSRARLTLSQRMLAPVFTDICLFYMLHRSPHKNILNIVFALRAVFFFPFSSFNLFTSQYGFQKLCLASTLKLLFWGFQRCEIRRSWTSIGYSTHLILALIFTGKKANIPQLSINHSASSS